MPADLGDIIRINKDNYFYDTWRKDEVSGEIEF